MKEGRLVGSESEASLKGKREDWLAQNLRQR